MTFVQMPIPIKKRIGLEWELGNLEFEGRLVYHSITGGKVQGAVKINNKKELKTMNELTNNPTNDINVLPVGIDPASLVPQDEQAVDTAGETTDLLLFDVSNVTLLESLVPEDEQGVTCADEDTVLAKAQKLGLFSPVADMSQIRSNLGNNIYAVIRTNEKGERFFEYCQRYSDGSFSPRMSVSQANLFLLASHKFVAKDISDRKLRSMAENFLTNAIREYLGKSTGKELIDVTLILRLLFMARESIRVDKNASTQISPGEFYNRIMEEARCLENYIAARQSYYPFNDGEITYIAERLEMKKQEFLKKLKENHLLYLTASSKGFQTCVRFTVKGEFTESSRDETFTEWRYCVFRLDNLKEVAGNK